MNILKTNKGTQNSIWELLLDYTLLIKKKKKHATQGWSGKIYSKVNIKQGSVSQPHQL